MIFSDETVAFSMKSRTKTRPFQSKVAVNVGLTVGEGEQPHSTARRDEHRSNHRRPTQPAHSSAMRAAPTGFAGFTCTSEQ